MANLYLIEIEIGYKGVAFQEYLKTWLEDVNYYLEEKKAGRAKHLYKVAAERKVYIVIEKNASELDTMMFEAPLMKKLGSQAKVKVTQLLTYETFTNNINKIISVEDRFEMTEPVKGGEGLYFWGEFNVGYTGSQDELLRTWSEEAAVALGAKQKGLVIDLWKCTGMRRVHCLVKMNTFEELDQMSFTLPIQVQNGANVDVQMRPLISFETFAEHLKKLTSE